MVRVAYTDLFLFFTLDAVNIPTITQTSAQIVNLYKGAFTAQFGPGHYTPDATNGIDTDDMFERIQNKASEIINAWRRSVITRGETKMPQLGWTDGEKHEVAMLKGVGIRHPSHEDPSLPDEIGDGN